MSKSIHLRSALIGGLIAGLVMTALPAIAARVGDPMELGVANSVARKTALAHTRAGVALQVTAEGGGSPLKLVSRDGSPPMRVNSSAKVVRLNADRLDGMDSTAFLGARDQATDSDAVDGYEANSLVRVASDAVNDLPDGNTGTFTGGIGEPLSVSITAPTAGWLVLTAAADARNTTADNIYGCGLVVDGNHVDGTGMAPELNGAGGTNEEEDCTTHGVAEVPAGTHTVNFRLFSVATTTVFLAGSLSAMFVPFDGTGAISTCVTNPCE